MKCIPSRRILPIFLTITAFFAAFFTVFAAVLPNTSAAAPTADGFYAGAVALDITPERPVTLSGQFYTRISKGV